MDISVPTCSLIDFVLRIDTPVWRKWNGDISELLDLLEAYVRDCPEVSGDWNPGQCILNSRRLALIDRLTGEQKRPFYNDLMHQRVASEIFTSDGDGRRDYWSLGQIIYGWGRRLADTDRHLILDVLQRAAEQSEHSDYGSAYEAAMTAWVETCPAEQSLSLLEWPEICVSRDIPQYGDVSYETLFNKYTEPRVRVTHIISKLAEISSEDINHWDNPYRALADALKSQLAEDLAPLIIPDQSDFPESDEALWDWFLKKTERVLDQHEIEILLRSDIKRRLRSAIRVTWIRSHNQETWRTLYDNLGVIDSHHMTWLAIQNFGRILPPNQPKLWEKLFALESMENIVMQAYCSWLPSGKHDELRCFFEGDAVGANCEHFDRAVCAYQFYLHRAPLEELQRQSNRMEAIPYWRLMLLDRFLYAPEPLKPGPIAWDIQEIEAAYVLGDPLDIRGY